jgi:hypothetical protein
VDLPSPLKVVELAQLLFSQDSMIPLVGTWAFIPTKEEMIASP